MLYCIIFCCFMLYYMVLYYITLLYYSALYYSVFIILYCIYYIVMLYYIKLYCIIWCFIILYYSISYYIVLYYAILYYIILYYIILYYIISYCIILYYVTLYYIILHCVCIVLYGITLLRYIRPHYFPQTATRSQSSHTNPTLDPHLIPFPAHSSTPQGHRLLSSQDPDCPSASRCTNCSTPPGPTELLYNAQPQPASSLPTDDADHDGDSTLRDLRLTALFIYGEYKHTSVSM
jgi:hypothetical protein